MKSNKPVKIGKNKAFIPYKRLAWLDAVRGLGVISMVAFYYMYFLTTLCGFEYSWFDGIVGTIWQESIAWTFILVSGFSLGLCPRPKRRGVVVMLCYLVVSAFTLIIDLYLIPGTRIRIGALAVIGTSMILVGLLKPVLIKIRPMLGLVLSTVLFLLARNVNDGYLGFYGINIVELPQILYKNFFTAVLGFPYEGFESVEYFSFIPWIFLFLAGLFLEEIYREKRYENEKSIRPVFIVGALGRNSLFIYVIQQVIILAILYFVYLR